MNVYHREIGFPKTLKIPDLLLDLQYSKHALSRTSRKKKNEDGTESNTYLYRLSLLPTKVRINEKNVYELYTEDDIHCRKVLIRIGYDERYDMIMVLDIINKNNATVVTIWLNRKADKHKTINKEKYKIPNNDHIQ